MAAYHMRHPYSSLRAEKMAPYASLGTLIETGTNVGHGVQAALDAGFKHVISVEADPALHAEAKQRFLGNHRVALFEGHSPEVLRELIPGLTIPCVFYLDAHSIEANPLLKELDAIALSPVPGHIIMIDDVRMFGTPDWYGLSQQEAVDKVLAINRGYKFGFIDTPNALGDLMVASVR